MYEVSWACMPEVKLGMANENRLTLREGNARPCPRYANVSAWQKLSFDVIEGINAARASTWHYASKAKEWHRPAKSVSQPASPPTAMRRARPRREKQNSESSGISGAGGVPSEGEAKWQHALLTQEPASSPSSLSSVGVSRAAKINNVCNCLPCQMQIQKRREIMASSQLHGCCMRIIGKYLPNKLAISK